MNQTSHLHRRFLTLVICFVLAFAFITPAYPPSYARAEAYEEGEGEPEDIEGVPNPETPDQGSETDTEEVPLPDTDPGEAEAGQETDEGEENPDDPLPEPPLPDPESSDLEGDPEGIEESKEAGEGEGEPEDPLLEPPLPDPESSELKRDPEKTKGGKESVEGEGDPEDSLPEPSPPEKETLEPEPSLEDPEEDEDEKIQIPTARTYTEAGPLVHPVQTMSPGFKPLSGGGPEQGLVLDKTAVYDPITGAVMIELEVFTTGDVITQTVPIPTDICLVLDQSGSMAYAFGSSTRQAALISAVKNFIGAVANHASDHSVDHRIGIVTFASSSTIKQYLSTDYGAATQIIENLGTPSGATNAGAGMNSAITVMNQSSSGRNQVVIMFTDGFPTTTNVFDVGVANVAVSHAKTLKEGGATVFAVGIFDGADPDVMYGDSGHYSGFDHYSDGTLNSYWDKQVNSSSGTSTLIEPPAANRFMNLLSSNSESAQNIGLTRKTIKKGSRYYDTFTISQVHSRDKTKYFLTASDPSGLNAIFQSISETIETPTISLGADTVTRDVVTPHLQVPSDTSEIDLYLADCTGYDTGTGKYTFNTRYPAPAQVTASIDAGSKMISVTGFNFNDNFVSKVPKGETSDDYGRKLIITFPIQPDPSFFGGNQVETNVNTSGVYKPGQPSAVGLFPLPKVDLPLKYELVDALVQKEYLGNPVDLGAIMAFAKTGGISYQPDGFNNSHVKITYRVYEGGTLLGSFVIDPGEAATEGSWSGPAVVPNDDKKVYTVQVDMEAAYAGTITAHLIKTTGLTVYRYRPVIETRDETLYLGQETSILPTSLPHYKLKEWKCRENDDNSGIHGIQPQLTLTPVFVSGTAPVDPAHYAPLETSDFKVQVTWRNTAWPLQPQPVDVTDDCWLYRVGEGYSEKGSNPNFTLPFRIYVKTCRITVEKAAASGTVIGANESFMIDIEDAFGNIWRLRVRAGESATLTGLPIGTYTVKEDRIWSWPYTPDPLSATVTLKPNAVEDHATVLVTNAKTIRRWITGETFVANLFKGLAGSGGGS